MLVLVFDWLFVCCIVDGVLTRYTTYVFRREWLVIKSSPKLQDLPIVAHW